MSTTDPRLREEIDHEARAQICIRASHRAETKSLARLHMEQAGVHATLALVAVQREANEQQRVSNLIALEVALEPRAHESYLLHNAQTIKDAPNPIWALRPEISKALGIGGDDAESES